MRSCACKSDPEVARSTPVYKFLFFLLGILINAERSKTTKSDEIRLKNEKKKINNCLQLINKPQQHWGGLGPRDDVMAPLHHNGDPSALADFFNMLRN